MKPRLLIFSNLYPLPWQPQRGIFNYQQFSRLADYFDIRIVVPVSFVEWYSNKQYVDSADINYQGPERWLFPYFFTPRLFRTFYPWMMKLSLRLQLLGKIKKFKPQYIMGSWLYPDGIVASEIAIELAIPYVLKAHGSDINVYLDKTRRGEAILEACNGAHKVVVVSQALQSILLSRGVPSSHIDVLYNGVDTTRFYPDRKQDSQSALKKILFVGNLKRDKGVMELLRAFAKLDNCSHCQLMIVGEGVARSEMESFVQSQHLEGRINFFGSLPHSKLPGLMNDADLLVLPSYREGVPNVLLEAMACGLPVVATQVGGIPEIVEPDITGILVPEKNVDALKSAIEKALSYNWDVDAIVSKSRQFSWEKNIQRLIDTIQGA